MDKSIEEIYKKLKNTDEKVMHHTVELSKEMHERELDRAKWSDDKASILLAVIGIIAGLLFFGLKGYSEIDPDKSPNRYFIIILVTGISMIFLSLSMLFLVHSLKSRPLNFVGDRDIFYIHASDNSIDIKRYVASLYLNAYQNNSKVINDKVTDRNIATILIVPAIFLIFLLILLIMVY
jgi:transcriptional regulator